MDTVDRLLDDPDACVAFRARRRLLGRLDDERDQAALRAELAGCPAHAGALLAHRAPDGTQAGHPYRKWQGAHWTLVGLAELGYPAGEAGLLPLRRQVRAWLDAPAHHRPPSTVVLAGQPDRVRRCASMEGGALWAAVELGLADDCEALVERLLGWRWPDGGWNCDRRPEARTSSVQETALPLLGLLAWRRTHGGPGADPRVDDAIDAACELLLSMRLLWRRRDGAPLRPAWGPDPRLLQWPVRLYDVLLALLVVMEAGRIGDPRCTDALNLLAGSRLPDGGFPAQVRTARRADEFRSGATFADWGPVTRKVANPFVTVDALAVLAAAGRAWATTATGGGGSDDAPRPTARECGRPATHTSPSTADESATLGAGQHATDA